MLTSENFSNFELMIQTKQESYLCPRKSPRLFQCPLQVKRETYKILLPLVLLAEMASNLAAKRVPGETGLGFAKIFQLSNGTLLKNLKLEFDFFSNILRQFLKPYSPVSNCRNQSDRRGGLVKLSKSVKGLGGFSVKLLQKWNLIK